MVLRGFLQGAGASSAFVESCELIARACSRVKLLADSLASFGGRTHLPSKRSVGQLFRNLRKFVTWKEDTSRPNLSDSSVLVQNPTVITYTLNPKRDVI